MTIEHEKMVDLGSENWSKVIFSDEKEVEFGCSRWSTRYYWHELRKEKETFVVKMEVNRLWYGFWADGTTEISILDCKSEG